MMYEVMVFAFYRYSDWKGVPILSTLVLINSASTPTRPPHPLLPQQKKKQ